MKKNIVRFMIAAVIFSFIISLFPLSCFALESDSGAVYEKSEDGTYIIITGISDKFFTLEIESEIDGLPVKEIAESAFQNNTSLIKVVIPDSVETIGEAAFRNCKSLVEVRLPSSLTFLPFECFRDCTVLNNITLPETIETIDDQCFQGCTKLGNLYVPASLKNIGHDAFLNCESIRLDVKDNEVAKIYAEQNSVNTEFKGTSTYFFLMMLVGCAAAFAVGAVIVIVYKKTVKKKKQSK